MTTRIQSLFFGAALGLASIAGCAAASAQAYPTKPITVIIPEYITSILEPEIGEDEDEALVQRCDTRGEIGRSNAYASIDLEIDSPVIAVPTHGANQLQELRDRYSAAAYQAQRSGRRSRLEDLVMWTDQDASRRQHPQHLRNTSRDHRLGDIEGRSGLGFAAPQREPSKQHADSNADDDRHNADPNRVHSKIVGSKSRPDDHVIAELRRAGFKRLALVHGSLTMCTIRCRAPT